MQHVWLSPFATVITLVSCHGCHPLVPEPPPGAASSQPVPPAPLVGGNPSTLPCAALVAPSCSCLSFCCCVDNVAIDAGAIPEFASLSSCGGGSGVSGSGARPSSPLCAAVSAMCCSCGCGCGAAAAAAAAPAALTSVTSCLPDHPMPSQPSQPHDAATASAPAVAVTLSHCSEQQQLYYAAVACAAAGAPSRLDPQLAHQCPWLHSAAAASTPATAAAAAAAAAVAILVAAVAIAAVAVVAPVAAAVATAAAAAPPAVHTLHFRARHSATPLLATLHAPQQAHQRCRRPQLPRCP